jgi:hypothetical protein
MMKSFPLEMETGHNDRIDVRVGGRKEMVVEKRHTCLPDLP